MIGGLRSCVIIFMAVSTIVIIEAETVEAVVHDEVNNATHGIRTVNGGAATGQNVHALNQRRRDEVQVSGG